MFFLVQDKGSTLAENTEWEVTVIPSSHSISFEWEDIGQTYVITQKNIEQWEVNTTNGKEEMKLVDEIIYNGSSSKFSQEDLDSKTRYEFEVSALDKEKNVLYTSNIDVSTLIEEGINSFSKRSFKQEKTPKEIFEESQIIANYHDNSLNIQWINLPSHDNVFEVYVDKVKISTVTETDNYSIELKDYEEHLYSVVSFTKKSQEEIDEIKQKAKENNINLTDEMLEKLSYQEFELSIVYKPSLNKVNSLAFSSQSTFIPMYTLQYSTFIPMKLAPNPVRYLPTKGGRIAYFSGDSRGFDFWSNSFRTRFNVNVLFGSSSKSVFYFPYTGLTKAYDAKGNFLDSKSAPAANDMWLTNIDKSKSNQISFKMNHASANPFTFPSPDINYEVAVTVQANGRVVANGWHDKAPSHEFYIVPYESDHVGTLYRQWHTDFLALFGVTTIWSVTR